jgi:hypothetical protein
MIQATQRGFLQGHLEFDSLKWPGATRTNNSVSPPGLPTRCLFRNTWYVLSAHPGQACFTIEGGQWPIVSRLLTDTCHNPAGRLTPQAGGSGL